MFSILLALPAPPPRRWLSRAESADYLGVTPRTVDNYIARGVLPVHRIRSIRTVRISIDDLDQLLEPVDQIGTAS